MCDGRDTRFDAQLIPPNGLLRPKDYREDEIDYLLFSNSVFNVPLLPYGYIDSRIGPVKRREIPRSVEVRAQES
jgi:hypothetical protein